MSIDWEEIKARHRIEDVMQGRGYKMRRSGTGFLAKCPLHGEQKGESFSIDTKKQLWKCFGKCQCGGDVIKLVMELEEVGAVEAAEILEGRKLMDDPPGMQRVPRTKREPVERPMEIPIMRELPNIPKLYKGEVRHWQALADLRKLPHLGGVHLAVQNDVVRFCLAYEQPAWAVLDVEEPCNVQVRRMDGGLWFERAKVMGIKHNWARWPVGLTVALKNPKAEIVLVEGTGDFIAAYHAAADGWTAGIPVAMFGASNPIHDGALALMGGRAVHIIEQHDEAGELATARWREQLEEAGCRVRCSKVPTPGEDLNDHLSAGRDLAVIFG